MKPHKPFHRFLLGAAAALVVIAVGAAWVGAAIATWGSNTVENARALPGDEIVPDPMVTWNHALTVHAPADAVYPWLAQIGDSRAAFYSVSFIENTLCATTGGCFYHNADRLHPEWQTPEKGKQGIIFDYMIITDYQPGRWVLATPTDKMPFRWTWLW